MKRFIRTAVILSVLMYAAAGCIKDPEPEPGPVASGSKTVIAYFFGTSLSYYFSQNVHDMQKAVEQGLGENTRLLLCKQNDFATADIVELRYDAKAKKVINDTLETIALPLKLDPSSFGQTMRHMMDLAPAERYSAIFLGHSTAWIPINPLAPAAYSYGRMPRFVPSTETMPGAAVTRDIGEDQKNGDGSVKLDIRELAEGLGSTGEKFEWLYFDVCFMSSLEAAYELRNTAGYVIGSPCEIMGFGSPYDSVLPPLVRGEYETACKNYWLFYEDYAYQSGCIAAIDCSKLDNVADVVKRINATDAADGFDITEIQSYEGRNSSGHWFFDAEDYFAGICNDEELIAEFHDRLSQCIVCRFNTEQFYSAYNSAMNDIHHYSGINLTPDEKCVEAIRRQLEEEPSASSMHSRLEVQMEVLNYYNPSLQQTAWYKATH